MAFFKKSFKKLTGFWYPQAITVGKPVSTDEVAEQLAKISTVSPGDTYNVLKDLGGVLADFMAEGRTVKLDGIGTFYYTAVATHQGVDSPDKVKASLITGVRVRFIPETTRTASNKVASRSLISPHIFWVEWDGPTPPGGEDEPEQPEDPTPPPPSGPVED
jgi:predicted histone-like DNA-binding protein